MANTIWPIQWPPTVDLTGIDPATVSLAETYAANTLRLLTLHRVGGEAITVRPRATTRFEWLSQFASARAYYPAIWDLNYREACSCFGTCSCLFNRHIDLMAPVGRVDEVVVGGVVLDPSSYRIDNGERLVRLDGEYWPTYGADDFTVTYLNAYPVDTEGQYVGGILANEYLKALTGDKKCRLPTNITMITRQGVTMEMKTGMFHDGVTGINEVDAYLMMWNPHGLRTRPSVYSPDRPRQSQTTWRAP